jgi:hypothetical protein
MNTPASTRARRPLPEGRSPLRALLTAHMTSLGINAEQLGIRLGYRNPAKARGRVQAIGDGYLENEHSRAAIARLAEALALSPAVVEEAVSATRAAVRAVAEEEALAAAERRRQRDAAYRKAFRPHAVLETEDRIPSQIVICMLAGGPDRFLRIDFDHSQPPETFAAQVVALLPERTLQTPAGIRGVPFFGRILGFFVNITPDEALHCDLDGRTIKHLQAAVRINGGSRRFT